MYNMVSILSGSSPYGYSNNKRGSNSDYKRNNNYYNRNKVYYGCDDENPYYCRSAYKNDDYKISWD